MIPLIILLTSFVTITKIACTNLPIATLVVDYDGVGTSVWCDVLHTWLPSIRILLLIPELRPTFSVYSLPDIANFRDYCRRSSRFFLSDSRLLSGASSLRGDAPLECTAEEAIEIMDRFVVCCDERLTQLRDRWWELAFESRQRPGMNSVRAITAEVGELLDECIDRKLRHTMAYDNLLNVVGQFLSPNVRVFLEARMTLSSGGPGFSMPSFSRANMLQYLNDLTTCADKLRERIERVEERVRNPFGLGDNVVVAFGGLGGRSTYRRLSPLIKACRKQGAVAELEQQIITAAAISNQKPKVDRVKILLREPEGLTLAESVAVHYKFTGKFYYPSAIILKADIERTMGKYSGENIVENSNLYRIYRNSPESTAKWLTFHTDIPSGQLIGFVVEWIERALTSGLNEEYIATAMALFIRHSYPSERKSFRCAHSHCDKLVVRSILGNLLHQLTEG